MSQENITLQAGCYSDSWRGIYQGQHIIEIARGMGYAIPAEYTNDNNPDSENYDELIDLAIEYLNTLPNVPRNHGWGWNHNGDFGLWDMPNDNERGTDFNIFEI